MEEVICKKDNLDVHQISENRFWDKYLKDIQSEWNKYCEISSRHFSSSMSFMNVRYSLFLLEQKYGFKTCRLHKAIFELGSVRNCIVQHDGNLLKMDKGGKSTFRETIPHTLDLLKIGNNEDRLSDLNNNDYLNTVIYGLQNFIRECSKF